VSQHVPTNADVRALETLIALPLPTRIAAANWLQARNEADLREQARRERVNRRRRRRYAMRSSKEQP
jgi:hypothetical protein